MTTLFVAESGDPAGEPLLLLPGGGFSGAMWQPQVEALQEYHCYVMDLPGHGRSDGDFSLAAAAEGVAQVIGSSFGGRPALVVGLSIGGAVGLELLCRRPELVKAALLSGPTPRLPRWLVTIGDLAGRPMLALMKPEQLAAMSLRQLHLPDQFQPMAAKEMAALTPRLFRQINAATAEVRLPAGPVPRTLAVAGEHEPGLSLAHVRSLARMTPGVTGALALGMHHGWNLEAPELFTATVRAWFNEQPLPAQIRLLAAPGPSTH